MGFKSIDDKAKSRARLLFMAVGSDLKPLHKDRDIIKLVRKDTGIEIHRATLLRWKRAEKWTEAREKAIREGGAIGMAEAAREALSESEGGPAKAAPAKAKKEPKPGKAGQAAAAGPADKAEQAIVPAEPAKPSPEAETLAQQIQGHIAEYVKGAKILTKSAMQALINDLGEHYKAKLGLAALEKIPHWNAEQRAEAERLQEKVLSPMMLIQIAKLGQFVSQNQLSVLITQKDSGPQQIVVQWGDLTQYPAAPMVAPMGKLVDMEEVHDGVEEEAR